MSEKTYLSDNDVAERLGVSRATIWRWTNKSPDFPQPYRFGGAVTRWKLSDLEQWESQCRFGLLFSFTGIWGTRDPLGNAAGGTPRDHT
jgi:prophage regulatory protein